MIPYAYRVQPIVSHIPPGRTLHLIILVCVGARIRQVHFHKGNTVRNGIVGHSLFHTLIYLRFAWHNKGDIRELLPDHLTYQRTNPLTNGCIYVRPKDLYIQVLGHMDIRLNLFNSFKHILFFTTNIKALPHLGKDL